MRRFGCTLIAGAGQSSFVRDVGYNSPFVDTAGTGFRVGVISGTSWSADVVNILQFGAGSLRSEFLAVLPTQPARVNSSAAGDWASSSSTSNTPGLLIFNGRFPTPAIPACS